VILESEEQKWKQCLSRTTILAGIRIDVKDEHEENAQIESRLNFDPDSNMISESEEQ
jgi:hypothetical protein